MDLHPRKDLLSHEACPDFVERRPVDEPRKIDADWISFVCGCVFGHVVREEVIVVDFCSKVLGLVSPRSPLKVIIVVLQELWLFVSLATRSFLCLCLAGVIAFSILFIGESRTRSIDPWLSPYIQSDLAATMKYRISHSPGLKKLWDPQTAPVDDIHSYVDCLDGQRIWPN